MFYFIPYYLNLICQASIVLYQFLFNLCPYVCVKDKFLTKRVKQQDPLVGLHVLSPWASRTTVFFLNMFCCHVAYSYFWTPQPPESNFLIRVHKIQSFREEIHVNVLQVKDYLLFLFTSIYSYVFSLWMYIGFVQIIKFSTTSQWCHHPVLVDQVVGRMVSPHFYFLFTVKFWAFYFSKSSKRKIIRCPQ